MERESMEFDVVIVGAGPSGLSAADLPDKAEIVPVKPGLENVRAYVQPGDIVVVLIAVLQRWIGSAALEFSEAGRSVTLAIAASPYRLNLTVASQAKRPNRS